MWNAKRSAKLSLVACVIAICALTVLMVFGHRFFQMYFLDFRGITEPDIIRILKRTLAISVYPGSLIGIGALIFLIQMLCNIIRDRVFVHQNVRLLRRISWCCFAVAALTAYAGLSYLPLLFVTAAAGFVGLILRVVKNVMQSAVTLREENDLTI